MKEEIEGVDGFHIHILTCYKCSNLFEVFIPAGQPLETYLGNFKRAHCSLCCIGIKGYQDEYEVKKHDP